ncbi:cell surface protein [Bacillus sp. FJAT-25509]|uniref:DUF871 domain-containing protein n=1 Tax=Bacillus sp. FJAT-25509 TaxID=1712029 RepID=UPI0006FB8420|nr:MupG family TIM beta-alpha barrel fold protein [Bacillus sp. FJAT-25509]KQL41114.1 cell surface protein [Bacillus sp. FJAT-25509]
MLGISIYLSEKNIEKNKKYIEMAKKNGFHSIFTSLHIPEDDPSTYKKLLQTLGTEAKENEMELMADISAKSLTHLGLDYTNVSELLNWGVTGLRVDYGLKEVQIADLSKKMKIALNASTLTPAFLDELLKYGLQTENVEAWHNFYPRPETGLATTYLIEKNKWLKSCGITTMAFIPGNDEIRGPLFKGLPTLEKHRGVDPLLAYLDLNQNCYVDKVLVGDISIKIETMEALSKTKNYMELRYKPYSQDEEILSIVEQVHTNREDPARDVIRSMESRLYGSFGENSLKPANTITRSVGSVTIDNELYGRYEGELQIMLTNLPSDEKVNVIGKIIEDDLSLLQYIGAGKKFKLMRV